VPDLVEEQVPDLVEEKANIFNQLQNIKKNLENLQIEQNNLQNNLKKQIHTEGVKINPHILEQCKLEDLVNILNKINEFGPVDL
jgi:flagellar biosynthesis chaperone FliJ